MKARRYTVRRGRLLLTDEKEEVTGTMAASCRHRKSGACGGCFARLYMLLRVAEHDGQVQAMAKDILEVMKGES